MKLSEFKRAFSRYLSHLSSTSHKLFTNRWAKLKIKVRHPTASGAVEEKYVNYFFIASEKKKIFLVGDYDEQRSTSIFSDILGIGGPKKISFQSLENWTKETKMGDYEVFFAWKYDLKDETRFDYIPMTDKFSADPSEYEPESVVMESDMDATHYKLKARNLRESLLESLGAKASLGARACRSRRARRLQKC